ncbi:MAG: response regulator [Sphingomicrobium sp.]
MDWFTNMIDAGRRLAPHGYCLLWDPGLIWTHVIADALIAAAYFSIPVALIVFVRRRPDIQFGWMLWLFALFIVACGTTHILSIWTLWHADYGIEAMVKAITAAASVATAILLWPLVPKLLAIPSPLQLAEQRDALALAHDRLTGEMAERKRAEEALRQAHKMEAVGQLTGGIAHDFNNLLQTVTGSLDMIARQPTAEKVAKWAQLGLRAAERGARVTAQLLAFSRTQKLELRPCVVGPLLSGMRELLGSAVGPTVDVTLDVAEGEAVQVLADPTQIELAVLNLAINARDAMPGGGTVAIATRRTALTGDPELPDGRYLCIVVSDDGTGMTEDVRDKAFDPFFTTKQPGQGTGLGLSMVYGVAKQSGGRAELTSAPGTGTSVSILLREIDGVAHAAAAPAAQPVDSAPMSILLVDDDEDVRMTTSAMLQALGHHVVEVGSGAEALGQLDAFEPQLVILDFAMPGMDGAETAARLRQQRPGLPILFATGFGDSEAMVAAVGADSPVVRKPYAIGDLAAAIQAALNPG